MVRNTKRPNVSAYCIFERAEGDKLIMHKYDEKMEETVPHTDYIAIDKKPSITAVEPAPPPAPTSTPIISQAKESNTTALTASRTTPLTSSSNVLLLSSSSLPDEQKNPSSIVAVSSINKTEQGNTNTTTFKGGRRLQTRGTRTTKSRRQTQKRVQKHRGKTHKKSNKRKTQKQNRRS